MTMHRRRLFALAGAAVLGGRRFTPVCEAQRTVPAATVLSAQLELAAAHASA
jgi:hypothetical protein